MRLPLCIVMQIILLFMGIPSVMASNVSPSHIPKGSNSYQSFLKSIPLFADLSEQSLDYLLQNLKKQTYHKGKILFLSGDHVEYLHIILEGWIKLFRETRDGHESVLSILGRGDVLGDTACLQNADYFYSCEVVDDTTLLQIPISQIQKMSQCSIESNDFKKKLLEKYIHAYDQRCLEVEHLTVMTSAQRIGCFLLKNCGHQDKGSATIQLPIDKYLVAGRLGMTPETFSRALNQLSVLGVETSKSEVKINNIEQLRNHVCHCCSALAQDSDFLNDDFQI